MLHYTLLKQEDTEMTNFIPYEKLSKKAKRQLNANKRGSWGAISPVTRMPPNPKAYNRDAQKRLTSKMLDSRFCWGRVF